MKYDEVSRGFTCRRALHPKGGLPRGFVVLASVVGTGLFACSDTSPLFEVPITALSVPDQVDFGTVRAGATKEEILRISSPNAVVLAARVEAEGDGAFSGWPEELSIAPGQTTVALTYAPALSEGMERAELTLSFPGTPVLSPRTVELVGRVLPGRLRVRPNPLDLGTFVRGFQVERTLTVTNADLAPVAVELTLEGDPRIELMGSRSLALQPEEERALGLAARSGARDDPTQLAGALRLRPSAGALIEVPLTATRIDVPLRCPGPLDLGLLGAPGRREGTVRCTNLSDQALRLGELTTTSTEGWSASLSATEVAPRGAVDVRVAFEGDPTGREGQEARSELGLPVVAVDGAEGTPPPAQFTARVGFGRPRLVVAPPALDFERVSVGQRATQVVLLRNEGAWPLELGRTAIDPADGPFSATGPTRIAPGAAVSWSVSFEPIEIRSFTGRLELEAAAPAEPGTPVEIALSGEGFQAPPCRDLVLSPERAELTFGGVWLDFTRQLPVRFENRGVSPCFVGPFPTSTAAVDVRAVDPRQIEVPPGESRDVPFVFAPRGAGPIAAYPRFYATTPAGFVRVGLLGAGVTHRVVQQGQRPEPWWYRPPFGSPTHLDFTASTDHCAAVTRQVQVDLHLDVRRSAIIQGPDARAFRLEQVDEVSAVRDALTVAYRPPSPGEHRAFLEVRFEASPEPVVVPLRGVAAPNGWVEERVPSGAALDVLVLSWFVDELGDRGRPNYEGGLASLAGAFDDLWRDGVDLRVATLRGVRNGGCPFSDLLIRHVPPPADPEAGWWDRDGGCGYFATGAPSRSDGRIVTPATFPSPGEALQRLWTIERWETTNGGSGFEDYNGAAMHAFWATSWPLRQTHNAGLPREDVPLLVLSLGGWPTAADFPGPVSGPLLDYFTSLVGDRPANVMFSAAPSDDEWEWGSMEPITTAPDACALSDGDLRALVEASRRSAVHHIHEAFTTAIAPSGGALVIASCPGWAERLVREGLPLNGHRRRFPLKDTPEPETLEVRIDGVRQPEIDGAGVRRWTFHRRYNRVDFEEGHAPGLGEEVSFRFRPACAER